MNTKDTNDMLKNTKSRSFKPIPEDVEKVGRIILDNAFQIHLGFLINFNVLRLKDGIRRMVV